MKKVLFIILLLSTYCFAQKGSAPPNSLLRNFKPFDTPRTNCRPGTVYRIDQNNVCFIVQDVKSIKSMQSSEGTLVGQMTFTKAQLLSVLNLDFNMDYITAEVEIKEAIREYNEQTNVDLVLWDEGAAGDLAVDEESKYFIIRETISSNSITFNFDSKSYDKLKTGQASLKEKKAKNGVEYDFPYSISKRFSEPKRFFYLEEKISEE
jgi:hypothetical protein